VDKTQSRSAKLLPHHSFQRFAQPSGIHRKPCRWVKSNACLLSGEKVNLDLIHTRFQRGGIRTAWIVNEMCWVIGTGIGALSKRQHLILDPQANPTVSILVWLISFAATSFFAINQLIVGPLQSSSKVLRETWGERFMR